MHACASAAGQLERLELQGKPSYALVRSLGGATITLPSQPLSASKSTNITALATDTVLSLPCCYLESKQACLGIGNGTKLGAAPQIIGYDMHAASALVFSSHRLRVEDAVH